MTECAQGKQERSRFTAASSGHVSARKNGLVTLVFVLILHQIMEKIPINVNQIIRPSFSQCKTIIGGHINAGDCRVYCT